MGRDEEEGLRLVFTGDCDLALVLGWGSGEGGAGDGEDLDLVVVLDLAGEAALAFLAGDWL